MPTVAELRSQYDETAICALALFIEGVPYVWVTDHDDANEGAFGTLLGSGPGSWMGSYETEGAYSTHEVTGQRIVVPGLKMPGSVSKGKLDPDTRMLESSSVTFEIVDLDGILAGLFASEGKDHEILGERIAPGFSAPDATTIVQGLQTVDVANGYVGIERFGPSRQRRFFYPFPFRGVGLHHQCYSASDPASLDGPAPTIVQTADSAAVGPLVWAGRQVALYRLYRDPNADPEDPASWAHWGEQFDAGALEWWGVLKDRGEIVNGATWRIQCFGPESLLRRKMATIDMGWMPVSTTTFSLSEEERGIAVSFTLNDEDVAGVPIYVTFESVGFTTPGLLPASGTPQDYADAIASIVADVADGTIPGDVDTGEGTFIGGDVDGTAVQFLIDLVSIRRGDGGPSVSMLLAVHEKVWTALGWELNEQILGIGDQPVNEYELHGKEIAAGENYAQGGGGVSDDSFETPGPGYWALRFSTNSLTNPIDGDNGGTDRHYRPKFAQGNVTTFFQTGDQSFSIVDGGTSPYIEPDNTVEHGIHDRARFFMFRGKRTIAKEGVAVNGEGEQVEDIEIETYDETQIGCVRWNNSGGYGMVDEGADGPDFYLRWFRAPRLFGVDRPFFDGEWASLAGTEYGIECKPLSAYGYRSQGTHLERAWGVLGQLLLSTGTAAGYSAGEPFDFGVNTSPDAVDDATWIADAVGSELGLGIPYQLVQSPPEMYAAFDLGDYGDNDATPHGGINQVRYVYGEPFESFEMIESILRPRGLAMTLRGGLYSVDNFGLFDPDDVDLVINETEVDADINDPRTVVPSQQLRAASSIDTTGIQVRRDPFSGEYLRDYQHHARDPGAKTRRGDLKLDLREDGLVPHGWSASGGGDITDPWEGTLRQIWAFNEPTWRAKRHFLVQVKLHRIEGQNCWPGTRVRFSNRWVFSPAGEYGVSGALGIVLSVTANYREETYDVEILVFADQFDGLRIFSPIARITNPYTGGASITLLSDANFLDHGEGNDGTRFSEPSWSSVGGQARVVILEYDRCNYTLHSADVGVVASTSAFNVTLEDPFATTFHAYTDKWIVMASWDDQASDGWVRALGLPIVEEDHEHSAGTVGFPFLNA